jgi:hypothetical protein
MNPTISFQQGLDVGVGNLILLFKNLPWNTDVTPINMMELLHVIFFFFFFDLPRGVFCPLFQMFERGVHTFFCILFSFLIVTELVSVCFKQMKPRFLTDFVCVSKRNLQRADQNLFIFALQCFIGGKRENRESCGAGNAQVNRIVTLSFFFFFSEVISSSLCFVFRFVFFFFFRLKCLLTRNTQCCCFLSTKT